MKQSNNNAVDLLLRSLARRERDGSPAGEQDAFKGRRAGSEIASEHLDADELNLYAEGVLPAPARSRYAEHLADCASCRALVVSLAQASGASARYETANLQSGIGWWQRFAALFTTPVLHYVLPALVLSGVIAIGLLALRQEGRPEWVARNQPVEPSTASDRAPVNEPRQGSSAETGLSAVAPSATVEKRAGTNTGESTADTSVNELKNNPVEKRGLLEKSLDTNSGTKPSTAAKDAEEYPHVAGATSSQPVFAPDPAPPKAAISELDNKVIVRKEEPVQREAQKHVEDGFKIQSKDDSATHGPARNRAPSVGGRLDARLPAENRAVRDKAKKEAGEEVETRSVSGRRFRRQGNAWIDTAYESSRSATNVVRGSEQFRALLADEPGLRAIVQQLGGEVVVVWKNRAYRIR